MVQIYGVHFSLGKVSANWHERFTDVVNIDVSWYGCMHR